GAWGWGFEPGRAQWWNTPGPQSPTWNDPGNASWIHLNCAFDGYKVGSAWGLTENCWGYNQCVPFALPMEIEYSILWFGVEKMWSIWDPNNMQNSYNKWQNTFMHEFGHAMGLSHHEPVSPCNALMIDDSCNWFMTQVQAEDI